MWLVEEQLECKRALTTLDGKCRLVLELHLQGFTLNEIGREVSLSRGRVHQLYWRAVFRAQKYFDRPATRATLRNKALLEAQEAVELTRASVSQETLRDQLLSETNNGVALTSRAFRHCDYEHCPTPHISVSRPRYVHAACILLKAKETRCEQTQSRQA